MKILVTYLDKLNLFSEKINIVSTYSLNNGITDIYFLSNSLIQNSVVDIVNLIPANEINKHLFLNVEDRLKLNLGDYYKLKEERTDVELIVEDSKILVTASGRFVFNNDFYDKSNINSDDEGIYITNGDIFIVEGKFISIDKVNSLLIDIDNNKFFKV